VLEIDGAPLVRRAALAALDAGCSPVVVVLGGRAAQVAPALLGLAVAMVVNPDWQQGIGSSIAKGVACVERSDAGAALVTLADQPLVGTAALQRLLAARHDARQPVAASRYAGTIGVPACFARAFFPLLRALEATQGCKPLLRAHASDVVLVDCPEAELDVDTPEDYACLLALRTPVRSSRVTP
jgi:molybdenum cofactor cytidylyltransferase